jgi:hypothetical protein
MNTSQNSKCGFFLNNNTNRGPKGKPGVCKLGSCKATSCVSGDSCGSDQCDPNRLCCPNNLSYHNYLQRKVRGDLNNGKCCPPKACHKVSLYCDKVTCECVTGCKNQLNLKSVNIAKSSDITTIRKNRTLYKEKDISNSCVNGKCVPSNVIKNNCVLNKCLTNGKSRTPISYNRMDNHRCGTTKKVKVAGTGADRITKLKQQMQYC